MSLLALTLIGLAAPASGDHFLPGLWQVQAMTECVDIPGNPQVQRETQSLSARNATRPAEWVFFHQFYDARAAAHVRVANGKIEGYYARPAVDDVRAQSIPVTGSYAPDRFRVIRRFVVGGKTFRQTVDGHWISPAR
jgi:hypothetical protein